MTIIRTAQTSNFTICANGYANDKSLSAAATAILHYLITKPPHWRFNANDIKRRFSIGLNKVYRCMRELISAGYAAYKRTQAKVEWFIYDTPQPTETATAPAVIDRVNFERVQNERVLERTQRTESIEKPQQTAPDNLVTPEKTAVVVLTEDESLVYPAQLTPDQTRSAKHRIKKLKQPEIAQDVLFALAYMMAQGSVKSPVAYLNELVTRANNGTFEAVGAAGAHNPNNPNTKRIDATQQQLEAYRTINRTEPGKAKGLIAGLKAAARGIK